LKKNTNMKNLFCYFLCFLYLCSPQLVAQQHGNADKPSIHGMMLMGTEKIYASHLPMFHSPHDYQVILLLEFSKTEQEQYIADKIANPTETVYTLEPESFVLPDMINNPTKFRANIYRGHFERGGKKIVENVSVVIQKVVYSKKFDPKETKPTKLQYILFGNSNEQFLAHLISAKPDFDENIAVKITDKKVLQQLENTPFLLVEFGEIENRKAFSWKKTQGLLKETKQSISFQAHQTLYIEFGDLE
jgi:hypothetical protein